MDEKVLMSRRVESIFYDDHYLPAMVYRHLIIINKIDDILYCRKMNEMTLSDKLELKSK